jgi:hypothetical protein
MDTYSVETDSDGGFRVRVINADGRWHVVTGFATERDAEGWLNEQIQIALKSANASDVA